MERKNTTLLTVIAIATLLVAVVGATFAYFTATASDGTSTMVTVTTQSINSTSATAGTIYLPVALSDMLEGSAGENVVANSASHTMTFSSTAGKDTESYACTYDLVYTPGVVFVKSAKNATEDNGSGSLNELTLTIEANIEGTGEITTTGTLGSNLTSDGSNGISEFDLSLMTKETTLISGIVFTIEGNENSDTTSTISYTTTATFYNQNYDQNDLAGTTYGGTLTFDIVECVGDSFE